MAETSTLVAKGFGISDDKVRLIGDIVVINMKRKYSRKGTSFENTKENRK